MVVDTEDVEEIRRLRQELDRLKAAFAAFF